MVFDLKTHLHYSSLGMKMDSKALAHSSAIVAFVIYILSLIAVVVSPEGSFNIYGLVSHGLDVSSQKPKGINFIQSLMGGILWAGFVWSVFYTLSSLYNHFRK